MTLRRFAFRAMGAENEVQMHTPHEALADRAAQAAIGEVLRIEAKYSRYRPDSVVSRINASAGGEAIEHDEETRELLAFAEACWHESGGLFDITSGVLRRAWRFDAGRVPADGELDALLPLIGWARVRAGDGIRLQPGMEVDFGGFGKE
jgi:thiamine biosynthesis lipoprotein